MNNYDGSHHYLPVDDNAMTWGMYITGAGHGVIHPGQAYPPVIHPSLYHLNSLASSSGDPTSWFDNDGNALSKSSLIEIKKNETTKFTTPEGNPALLLLD